MSRLEHFRADVNVDEKEAPADDERTAKERLHLLRRRAGRNVEVLRREPQQQVAHGAADDEGLEPGFVQFFGDHARAARDLFAANRMLVGAVNLRVARRPAGDQAGEQAADHRGGNRITGGARS
jgi:hypothetical protein